MSKCLRCGKEIDLIFKKNDEVFYCKDCSMKILQNGNTTLNRSSTEKKDEISMVYYMIPGLYQLKKRKIFVAISYITSLVIIPMFWVLFLYALDNLELLIEKIKIMTFIITVFILLNMIFVIAANILEVIKEE